LLRTRVLAALVFTPAFIALVLLGDWYLQLTCLVMVWLLLWEFLQLTLDRGQIVLKAIAFLLATGYVAWVFDWIHPMPGITGLATTTMVLLVAGLARPMPVEGATVRVALVGLGIFYCAGLFPLLSPLRDLQEGLSFAAIALFCTWSADTGAYFSGRFFGRTRLYPSISPKKTVEGLVGGVVTAVAIAFFIRWLFGTLADANIGAVDAVLCGVLAAAAGTLGDLAASMIKRSVGAKDSGTLIPGHGGVLDRFDGVLFSIPAVYVYALLLPRGGG
jgi:phosphatidate cytidylyltransferase